MAPKKRKAPPRGGLALQAIPEASPDSKGDAPGPCPPVDECGRTRAEALQHIEDQGARGGAVAAAH